MRGSENIQTQITDSDYRFKLQIPNISDGYWTLTILT